MTMLTDTIPQTTDIDTRVALSGGEVSDYVALLKPRVMSLVVFTALVGIVVTHASVHPVIAFGSLVMIAIGAGAAGCLNMWWDADIDAVMTRTCRRPIPAGRLDRDEALPFGLILAVGSVLGLGLIANWFAAAFLAFTIFFYVVVYSMWLKRATVQNIVIGGAAGAFPPMVAAAAVSGTLNVETFVLFLIIFLWTPPHFWALALVKSRDFQRAGLPMLPNVAGPDSARCHILAYSLLLAPCGLLPVLLGFGGIAYAIVAALGGAVMIVLSVQAVTRRGGEAETRIPQHLFAFSILYLFLVFAALLAEHGLGLFRPVQGLVG